MGRKLWLGHSGIPLSTGGKGLVSSVETIPQLGLDARELAFVQSVYMRSQKKSEGSVNEKRTRCW